MKPRMDNVMNPNEILHPDGSDCDECTYTAPCTSTTRKPTTTRPNPWPTKAKRKAA